MTTDPSDELDEQLMLYLAALDQYQQAQQVLAEHLKKVRHGPPSAPPAVGS